MKRDHLRGTPTASHLHRNCRSWTTRSRLTRIIGKHSATSGLGHDVNSPANDRELGLSRPALLLAPGARRPRKVWSATPIAVGPLGSTPLRPRGRGNRATPATPRR